MTWPWSLIACLRTQGLGRVEHRECGRRLVLRLVSRGVVALECDQEDEGEDHHVRGADDGVERTRRNRVLEVASSRGDSAYNEHCRHAQRGRTQDDQRRQPEVHGSARLATGSEPWLHLRIFLECGYVGCCDQPPHRHATAHANATGHAIIRSLEPGEEWAWCCGDRMGVLTTGGDRSTVIPPSPLHRDPGALTSQPSEIHR